MFSWLHFEELRLAPSTASSVVAASRRLYAFAFASREPAARVVAHGALRFALFRS